LAGVTDWLRGRPPWEGRFGQPATDILVHEGRKASKLRRYFDRLAGAGALTRGFFGKRVVKKEDVAILGRYGHP